MEKNNKIIKKNIDVLKFISLFCIILAHVKPPQIIFQIRNFDVILMMLISSYLFLESNKNYRFIEYIKKRFLRLIIPTWIFLIIFFIIYKSTGEIKNTNYYKYPFRLYYLSYALFISSVLICIYRFDKITNVCYNSYVRFVSSHSLYFYLWHILFIYIFKDLSILWLFKYLLIICLTSIIVFIQNIIINYMERKKINSNIINLFRG